MSFRRMARSRISMALSQFLVTMCVNPISLKMRSDCGLSFNAASMLANACEMSPLARCTHAMSTICYDGLGSVFHAIPNSTNALSNSPSPQ